MYIKKIEIQGFKSFYKRSKIEFHPGVTAIVGPNGCGKSNLVDAIIWALGEGRLRALKGDRVGELIFNGSQKREPAGMAEVVLWVEDESWEEPLSVGRIIYRSGESEFRINGKKVRLKDVQDELWKRGLGGKDYFVIEQGSIGAIISYKPNEKRALIEEAAGIVKYKERKREAKQKLEDAKQNLVRIEDIILEAEKQKNSLQRQASLSRKYKNLRARLRDLSILFFHLKSRELTYQFEEINLKIADSELKEKSLKERILSLEEKLKKSRESFLTLDKEIRDSRSELFGKRTKFEKEKAHVEKEEKRKILLLRNIEESQREIGSINRELEEWEKQEKRIFEEIDKNRESKEKSQKKLREMENLLNLESRDYEEFMKGYSDLKKEISEQMNLSSTFLNQLKGFEKELVLIKKSRERLSSEKDGYLEILNKEWDDEKLTSLKESLNSLKEELKKKTEKIEKLRDEIKEMEREGQFLEIKRGEISVRLEMLSKNNNLEKVEGVYGRLKDFLKLEKKYVKGAEKIWEKELSSFVVEDKERVLSLIKNGKLKGDFLFPLRKEKVERSDLPQVRPEIGLPEKISLPEILMVETIEEALKLLENPGNFNFITPDGISITPHGLLSVPSEEGALSLKEEIESLERELKGISEELERDKILISSKRREINLLEAEKENMVEEIEKNAGQISNLEMERNLTTKEKERAQESIKRLQEELGSLEKEEKKILEEIDKVKVLLEETNKKIDVLKEKIRPYEEEANKKEEKISRLKEEITYEKGMASIFEGREKDMLKNLENMKSRKDSLLNRLKELGDKIELQKKEVEEISTSCGETGESLKKLESEIADIESVLQNKESQQKEIKEEIEALDREFHSMKKFLEEERERKNTYEIRRAEIRRDLLHIEERVWNETSLTIKEIEQKVEGMKAGDPDKMADEIERIKKEIDRFGPVNLLAEQELEELKQRLAFLKSQRDDVKNSIESIKKAIEKMDEESRTLFMQAFEEVRENFKKTFSMLFEGGNADLRLQDMDNPLETGVEIFAQPPGKRLLNLNLLSGGEKALTSLAFLFALFLFKPSPFCVFDEVDAPLDDANLGRFLKFIDDMKPYTQFIIITHNPKTIEKADYIYGITMDEPGVSTVYSMRLDIINKSPKP